MTPTEFQSLATKITSLKELIQSQDSLREKASVERHKHINKALAEALKRDGDQDDRIDANTKGRHVLWGIYLGSATVLTTIWIIFTFIIE